MTRWPLRMQLVAMGLLAAVGPVLALLVVVLQVEETENIDGGSVGRLDVVEESGVSPWIPLAALLLSMVAIVLVWFWAKRAVDPIERMTKLTDEVQAGSLDRRLALDSAPVELRDLGESFDRMLDRLATASTLERRLIEDASHELRTPLAALSARIEVAQLRTDAADVDEDLHRCATEVERMQSILETLLASARSRSSELEQVDNDVAAIVGRVVEHRGMLSPEVDLTLDSPNRVLMGIDGVAVERAVTNLVTNAVVHGGGTPVAVIVVDHPDAVEIMVTDHGPGIPPSRLPHIFERYAGADHGIGLAVVKQVADVYGRVDVISPIEGRTNGTTFVLSLRRD